MVTESESELKQNFLIQDSFNEYPREIDPSLKYETLCIIDAFVITLLLTMASFFFPVFCCENSDIEMKQTHKNKMNFNLFILTH